MGKKNAMPTKGPQQKHIYSRISFLYQAAQYLSVTQELGPDQQENPKDGPEHMLADQAIIGETSNPTKTDYVKSNRDAKVSGECAATGLSTGLSRLYATQMRAISRKSTIRLTPNVKCSVCKRCDNVFKSGSTCTTYIENNSRNGRKPWADVLVTKCHECGSVKRFPVGSQRQQRKQQRNQSS